MVRSIKHAYSGIQEFRTTVLIVHDMVLEKIKLNLIINRSIIWEAAQTGEIQIGSERELYKH